MLGVSVAGNTSLRVGLAAAVALLSSSVLAVPASSASEPAAERPATAEILQRLGGEPCPDGSAFTCVTLTMPLDHFDPAGTRTVNVVFAVLPARGVRKGMFVTAAGGPGQSGVSLADDATATFDPGLSERFDIVFFDPRGVALSGGVDCPKAAAAFHQTDLRAETPEQEAHVKDSASTFAHDCVNELGPDAALLPYLGTDQAVEDLERFRQVMADDHLWLYGQSYGTQYAQTYAAAHGSHLAGLLLDGTVDLTLTDGEFFADQARAFSDTLLDTLTACNDDPACSEEVHADAVGNYDHLAEDLEGGDIPFRFPPPSGGSALRQFSLADLESVAAAQMYGEGDRMLLNRALVAWASHGDLVPLARLLYAAGALDPETLDPAGDAGFSDAMYYAVECRDHAFPGASPEEKAENHLRAGDPVEAAVPRLASVFQANLACAYWPAAPAHVDRPAPLTAEGIPTLVLGGTADPATPHRQGVEVFGHLDDGYLITKQGGPHVIFGSGDECVDGPVTRFLLDGEVPGERRATCAGVVTDGYVRLTPEQAGDFADQLEAMRSVETEINHLPEYVYWDGADGTQVGCPYGGTLSFAPDARNETFTFNRCTFTQDFTFTGAGTYNVEEDTFDLDVATTGRWDCALHYERSMSRDYVTGPCPADTAA